MLLLSSRYKRNKKIFNTILKHRKFSKGFIRKNLIKYNFKCTSIFIIVRILKVCYVYVEEFELFSNIASNINNISVVAISVVWTHW